MKLRSILSISVAANALLFAQAAAYAQATEEPAPGSAAAAPGDVSLAQVGEIIVTGSRIARQGFDAPTPTKLLSVEDLQRRGSTNVGDFLNEIPAFRPSQNNQTNTQTSTAVGQNYADLRSLGNIRTLTLVDGRRHVPSAPTGQIDLNLVPTILVNRVEVVTGGASAAYGSDAISGVVNIILDKKLQGIKGDFSTGISNYGDNFERRFSLGAGTSFADDRGHIVIGGDYVKSNGVRSFEERPWGPFVDEIVSFPANRAAGTPSRIFGRDTAYTNSPEGGIINGACSTVGCTPTALPNGSPFIGIQFGPNGQPIPFNYGNDTTRSGTSYDNSSDGIPTRLGHTLVLPVKRYVGMAHLSYDFSDSVRGFVEGTFAHSGSRFGGPGTRDTNTSTIVIRRDNAFLPTATRDLMIANNVQAISLGRHSIDYGQSMPDNKNVTKRVVAGLEGELGGGWSWDAYYQWGRNKYDSTVAPTRINANFAFAVDAVVNPANGQIVCRATLPGASFRAAAAGCVPINLFGRGRPSAEAVAYSYGTVEQRIITTQEVAAANVRGNLFDTWAGPVAIAFGGEYRRDKSQSFVDPLSAQRAFNFGNPQPFSGTFNVKEGYIEADVPLAKDTAFAKSLNVNGAYRYTDYSFSGVVKTWKIGATYEPGWGVKFRGVISRDIRAPNAQELFLNTQTNSTFINRLPGPANGQTAAYTTLTLASPNLQPEKAKTKTAGVVFTPTFAPGLNISADYYDINLKGAIATLPGQNIIDNCANELGGNPSATGGFFCTFVNRGVNNSINSLSIPLLNLASIKTRGVDFDMSYRHRVGDAGSLIARFFGTYVADLITDDGQGVPRTVNAQGILQTKGSVINRAGQVGGFTSGTNTGATSVPHWQLNGSLTYASDLFSVTAQGRYIQGGKVDRSLIDESEAGYDYRSPISVGNNDVSDRFYLNLSGSLNIVNDGNKKLQFYTVVNNVTNVAPPHPDTQVAGFYDRIGRFFRVGLRFAY